MPKALHKGNHLDAFASVPVAQLTEVVALHVDAAAHVGQAFPLRLFTLQNNLVEAERQKNSRPQLFVKLERTGSDEQVDSAPCNFGFFMRNGPKTFPGNRDETEGNRR